MIENAPNQANPLDDSFEESVHGCSETYWEESAPLSSIDLIALGKLLAHPSTNDVQTVSTNGADTSVNTEEEVQK
jgi:hypothetical protein